MSVTVDIRDFSRRHNAAPEGEGQWTFDVCYLKDCRRSGHQRWVWTSSFEEALERVSRCVMDVAPKGAVIEIKVSADSTRFSEDVLAKRAARMAKYPIKFS